MKRMFKQMPIKMIALLLVAAILLSIIPLRNTWAETQTEDVPTYAWSSDGSTQLDFHNNAQTIPLTDFAGLFGWTSPLDMIIRIYDGDEVVFTITDIIGDLKDLANLNLESLQGIGVTLEGDNEYRIEKGTIDIKWGWPISYDITWSQVAQFSTKTFDMLTVESNKADLVSVNGLVVSDTASVKVYKGEHPEVVVSMGDLQNHDVTAKIGEETILTNAGTYVFSNGLTSDTTLNVVYVEDTESEVTLGTVSQNVTVEYPLTIEANSTCTIRITPEAGYFIDTVSIDCDGDIASISNEKYENGVWSGDIHTSGSKQMFKINCVAKPIVVLLSNGISYNDTTTIEEATQSIFELIDKENSAPIFNDINDVAIFYNASFFGTEWKETNYQPADLDKLTKHAFGFDKESETVKIVYNGNGEKYQAGEFEFDVSLTDSRSNNVAIDINPSVEFVYGQFTQEDVLSALLNGKLGVYDTVTGEKISNATIDLVTNTTNLFSGEHQLTVRFAGNKDYQGCSATATIKIERAPVQLTVNSANVVFGETITIDNLVSTDPANVANVTFVVGLNAVDKTIIAQVDISDLTHFDGIVGEAIDTILGTQNGRDLTLTEFKELLDKLTSVDSKIDFTALNYLVEALNQFQNLDGVDEVLLTLSTDGNLVSQNVGAYVVGSVIADINYEYDIKLGYLVIKPDAQKVTLSFNQDLETILSFNAMKNNAYDMMTGIKEEEHQGAIEKITNVFFGLTSNGEFQISNEPIVEIGGYAQLAYINDFGNTMCYAMPIARAYAVLPDEVTIQFIGVDESDNSILVTFDKTQHIIPVIVTDKDGQILSNDYLTVKYIGVDSRGGLYNETDAPSYTGVYAIVAIYNDVENNMVGFNTATMIVEAADSEFEINDATYDFDGTEKFVQIKNPNALVHIDLIVNDNTINIITPNAILEDKATITGDDIVTKLKEIISSYVELNPQDVPQEAIDIVNKIEEYTVTINGNRPSAVGEYDIYSFAFGYDYKAAIDSAKLTIKAVVNDDDKDGPTNPEDPNNPEEPSNPENPQDPTEPSDPSKPTNPEQPKDEPKDPEKPGNDTPQTGDDTNLLFLSTTCGTSFIGLIILMYLYITSQNKGKYLATKNRKGKYSR